MTIVYGHQKRSNKTRLYVYDPARDWDKKAMQSRERAETAPATKKPLTNGETIVDQTTPPAPNHIDHLLCLVLVVFFQDIFHLFFWQHFWNKTDYLTSLMDSLLDTKRSRFSWLDDNKINPSRRPCQRFVPFDRLATFNHARHFLGYSQPIV